MIPKILHQVWLGEDAIPEAYKLFTTKWLQLHPNWEYKIWNSINIKKLKSFKKKYYEKLNNYAEKTDYLRFCILLEFGGVYIDMDFEPFKSIEELISKYSFFIGERPEGGVEIAILGSLKGHAQIKKIFNQLTSRIMETSGYSHKQSSERIGPCWISDFFKNKKIGERFGDNCIIFPKEYFYPVQWKYCSTKKPFSKKIDTSKSYGMHHYNAHWKSKSFQFIRYVYNIPYLGGIITLLRKVHHKINGVK